MITLFEENETLMQIGMPDARTPNRPLIARPTTRTDSPTYKPKSSSKIPAKIKKKYNYLYFIFTSTCYRYKTFIQYQKKKEREEKPPAKILVYYI